MSYKYGMRSRPFGVGCQPSGHEKYEDSNKKETGYWGFIYYPEPLPESEVKKYELVQLTGWSSE